MCKRCQILERQNRRLAGKLATIATYSYNALQQAAQVTSQKSGVPRGQWRYAKGVSKIAVTVLKLCH